VKLLLAVVLATTSVVATRPAPARLQVVAREYSFTLSRLQLKAGDAEIELDNFGEDVHDLRLQRHGARHIAGLGLVPPGARGLLSLHLRPGRYLLWCSVADHRARGMQAALIVRR
jgi:plastocyanin